MNRDIFRELGVTRWRFVAAIGLFVAAAVFLYWPSLYLPIIYDDLLHIRIAKNLDLLTVWFPTEAFGYYRPLTFAPLLVIKGLFGYYPAWLLHGLNVGQHALNTALLGWLSWRLWQRPRWALLTGLLFALFPFSYQAVAVYGHNVHPATAGLILLALHGYLWAQKRGRRLRNGGDAGTLGGSRLPWLFTAVIFTFALLSHESAILFGAFAGLVHWTNGTANRSPFTSDQCSSHLGSSATSSIANIPRLLSRSPWIFFLITGALYTILYQLLPLSRAPETTAPTADLWLKALYLLQAAAYPFTWLAHRLPYLPADTIILAAFFLTLVLTFWAWRRGLGRPLLLGWGWFGLASLVIALPLPAGYLLHGPRLLYLGSIGLAIVWPVLLEPLWRKGRPGRALWLILVIFILATNWQFVRGRLHAYTQLTEPIRVIEAEMAGRPAEEGIISVNLPQWIAPPRNRYALGAEFVAMLGDYLFLEELMAENLDVDRPVLALKLADLLDDPGYGYAVHNQNQAGQTVMAADWAPAGSHFFITRYTAAGPHTGYTGFVAPAPMVPDTVAQFGPYALMAAEAQLCPEQVPVTLVWQLRTNNSLLPTPDISTLSIFVQLLDGEGLLITQADGPPLGLRPDLLALPPHWQIVDRRSLQPESDQPSLLLVGAYDYLSGERLAAVDDQGRPLTDRALPLALSPCRQ
jgi:hypothetical protein